MRGSQGSEACSQLRAPFVEVMFGAGKGRATHLSPTHSYPSLRHRDDAPSPLLLGILATETQKRMKEEEEELKKRGTTGKERRELRRQMLQSAAE